MEDVLKHNKKLYYNIHHSQLVSNIYRKPATFNKIHNVLKNDYELENYFKTKKIKFSPLI